MTGMSNKRGDTKRWLSRPLTRFSTDGTLRQQSGTGRRATFSIAEGDYVMVHGRYSGGGRPTRIVVDILRIEAGRIVEHWDVMQDEATRMESKSGLPMFGDRFPGE